MHFRASKLARLIGVLAVIFAFALPVSSQSVATMRVRLHPDAAAAGTLPPVALARLQALVGTGLSLSAPHGRARWIWLSRNRRTARRLPPPQGPAQRPQRPMGGNPA
jgi:hypothetical protein